VEAVGTVALAAACDVVVLLAGAAFSRFSATALAAAWAGLNLLAAAGLAGAAAGAGFFSLAGVGIAMVRRVVLRTST